jgi:hypothetical protein
LKYDLEGKRLGPITPPPLSSLSFQVRNHGDNGWPVVLLGMKNKYMGPGVDSLVIVNKDGSISEAPWPKIKANFFTYVFHNGQNLYVQAPKGWFRCVIGEENAVPVTWEEVQEAGPSDLSWHFFDASRATQSLPKVLPPIFKKYVDVSTGSHTYGLTENNNSNQIRSLRLWGKDPQKGLGDILLIPALLKDNSAMLVGVSLPENKVVFCLPVLHIKGLPQEDYSDGVSFIYGVRYLDDRRALLIVGETLNSYKVYSLIRPAMPLDAPAN